MPERKIDIRAAGGVVWRVRNKEFEVLIIHRPKYNDWSFPKGKLKPGEHLRDAAVRELGEESREKVILGQPLGWLHYETDEGNWKQVRYWTARAVSPKSSIIAARPKIGGPHKGEIDDVRWVGANKAMKKLTRRGDRELLERVVRLHKRNRLDTTALVFVRHTRAKKRSAWPSGDEATRPLTNTGKKRAKRLVPALSYYGVERVVSSPWKRCADTVAPYADIVGTEVEYNAKLTEDAFMSNPDVFEKMIRKFVTKTTVSTAISLHRPTLPAVMRVLGEYSPQPVISQIPKRDPWLLTGEMIIAHVARGIGGEAFVVALERTRPTADA